MTRFAQGSVRLTIGGVEIQAKGFTVKRAPKPHPASGQWWRFDGKQTGRVSRVLPGGSGDLGIVEFADYALPAAHVATMIRFDAWQACSAPPGLEAPCTCVDIGDGVALSDGCARHKGDVARAAGAEAPALEART